MCVIVIDIPLKVGEHIVGRQGLITGTDVI